MKKKLIIIFLVIIHASSWAQKDPVPKGNCTDALAMKTIGKWLKQKDNNTVFDGVQQQEAYQRLDQVHQVIMKMFPQPAGVDVRWKRSIGTSYFGTTRKYYIGSNDALTFDFGKPFPIAAYSYSANFSPHYCAHTEQGIVLKRGEENESSAGIGITINTISDILSEGGSDDSLTIDGYPVKMFSPVAREQWNGFTMQYAEPGSHSRTILIHRKGMLPYKPVSRKQYLDYCISYYQKLYDGMIMAIEKRPLRTKEEQESEKRATLARIAKQSGRDDAKMKAASEYYLAGYRTDEQLREEELIKMRKIKDAELKKFTDEFEKTTREGLLDSPARVLVKYYSDHIFESDPEKGYMLVTEKSDYIRKDLPAYIPQLIVISWKWTDYPPHIEFEKMFKKDFPIEMLQAMIDK